MALNAQLGLDGLRATPFDWSNFLPNCTPRHPTAATCGPVGHDLHRCLHRPLPGGRRGQDHVAYWMQVSGGEDAVSNALVDDGWWEGDVHGPGQLLLHGARRAVGRCAPVTMWEPWNEPNNTGWTTAATYVTQVLEPFYKAVKSVRPARLDGHRRILPQRVGRMVAAADRRRGSRTTWTSPPSTPTPATTTRSRRTGSPPRSSSSEHARGKPLWFTEVGWWSDGDYDYLTQANAVARAMIWQKVLGIPVENYFFDEGNWGNDGVWFSLIQASDSDDYVKPAALATMATSCEIAGRPYLSMPPPASPRPTRRPSAPTSGWQRPTGAVWSDGLDTTGSVTVTAPGGGSIPVTVTSEYGQTTTVGRLGHRLQPAASPTR